MFTPGSSCFRKPAILLSPASSAISSTRWFLVSPDSHTLNTKDLKLWKSSRESGKNLILCPLLLAGLEQTFKATWSHTSRFYLVCWYCFVLLVSFPVFWGEGWCSSQYYYVVEWLHIYVELFCLLHKNVTFFVCYSPFMEQLFWIFYGHVNFILFFLLFALYCVNQDPA